MEKSKLDKETSEVTKKDGAQYSHIDDDKVSAKEDQSAGAERGGYPKGKENQKSRR